MKDYRAIVQQNAGDNFEAFKEAELAKPKAEIFADAYKIFFMETVADFFDYDDSLESKVYAFLARDKDRILDRLYNHYMKEWGATVSTDEEISDFVRGYYDMYSARGSAM